MMQFYDSKYYQKDKRVGSRCLINGKDAYESFNADLVGIDMIPGILTVDFRENPGMSGLNVFNSSIQTRGRTFRFYVGGSSEEEAEIHVSDLLAECKNCIVITEESRFEYVAVMNGYTDEKPDIDYFHFVTISFAVVYRLPLVTVELNGTGTVYNEGNQTTGLKLEIMPNRAISSMRIAGITVKNLVANQPFIIDGITGQVMSNTINRFADTDLIDFPKAEPGMNEIEVSVQVPVKVSFYPVFL
ncbi:hypothetical protein LQE92_14190 [Lacrimispora sp. NSJ-141]|uniref:Uncharacterized protein n=1 Tax=Lientehia hominis TaxID=2897778 RepID=A0AAP2RK87_9FIRM|nr:hypothetical protein [Lientehia hominis]MCD2493754.1 hypothetical protein [Lientehia hominis]